jgi:hypothetical protein
VRRWRIALASVHALAIAFAGLAGGRRGSERRDLKIDGRRFHKQIKIFCNPLKPRHVHTRKFGLEKKVLKVTRWMALNINSSFSMAEAIWYTSYH